MKKLIWSLLLLTILAGCGNKQEKKQMPANAESKQVKKDDSALRYKMIKLENLSVEQAAKLFKDYLEEEGLFYPKFLDFKKAANLDNVKFDMRPTLLVIFGHPKEMGKLINENPEAAYDLPFRILLYRDAEGNRWLLYRDFDSFKEQYILTDPEKILDKYKKLLQGFEKRLQEVQIKHQNGQA